MELDDIIKGRELLIMQQKLHYEELCYYPGEPPGVFGFFISFLLFWSVCIKSRMYVIRLFSSFSALKSRPGEKLARKVLVFTCL